MKRTVRKFHVQRFREGRNKETCLPAKPRLTSRPAESAILTSSRTRQRKLLTKTSPPTRSPTENCSLQQLDQNPDNEKYPKQWLLRHEEQHEVRYTTANPPKAKQRVFSSDVNLDKESCRKSGLQRLHQRPKMERALEQLSFGKTHGGKCASQWVP